MESEELAAALRALRVSKSPKGALEHLDRYAQRFPQGLLAREASVARAEALLALGRSSEALAVLEGLDRSGERPERGISVARGELRAQAGRCIDARNDFDAVIASNVRDTLDERALYGRGFCRLHSKDRDGARADLTRYLELYPAGRFATAVRQALGEQSASTPRP
jgi:outer membrane protein assembly factor BamD (BamD/ComL family)